MLTLNQAIQLRQHLYDYTLKVTEHVAAAHDVRVSEQTYTQRVVDRTKSHKELIEYIASLMEK